ERTLSRRVRARERAALVTEQLTIDELLGQRRAVHGDEWLLRSPTQAMNVPGNELLPGAALSDDEYRARDRCDAGDRVLELLHRGAGTPQRRVLRRITTQGRHLGDQDTSLDRRFDFARNAFDWVGLVDERVGA